MSILSGVPVSPLSRVTIEKIIHKYLSDNFPDVIKSPTKLDVDMLLDVALRKTHGFMVDIVDGFMDPKIEAKTLIFEKKIQITERCHNQLEYHGRSRFTACHEGCHVILHAEQLLIYAIEPARIVQRELKVYEDPEWQAEHGGGALLMPLATVSQFVDELRKEGLNEKEIANEVGDVFAVSDSAATARIKKISQTDLASLAYILRQN